MFSKPPPISKIISPNLVPIGISTKPLFLIFPARAKTFVPGLSSVPKLVNQSAPLLIISETFESVSTLFIIVGLPFKPDWAGNGGLGLGSPLPPSIEAIKAVSSPHTNAPAPNLNEILKSKPDPNIFSPSKPISSASLIAFLSLLIAKGYSALQ